MVTWVDALARTRRQLAGAVRRLLGASVAGTGPSFGELEESLLGADVPVRLAEQVMTDLEKGYKGLRVSPRDMLTRVLEGALGPATASAWGGPVRPCVVLVVGVNGSGKTTTCAKLAHRAAREGLKPLLGATDTFRAAGADQLKLWAERLGCDVVAGEPGADAAAVAYDALGAAAARGKDVLIIDTAGRMHTRAPLMQELKKIRAALSKRQPDAPHETWVVLDATLGQNAVVQARVFNEAVPLTGAIVTKLDGSARAGFVFSIVKDLRVPIRFAGLGEGPDDLVPFDPPGFVKALLGEEADAA